MRRSGRVLIGCLVLVLCAAFACPAKEWRGIVPLKSTRSDVLRLLGPPKHLLWDYRDYFILEAETVTFTWVDPSCTRKYPVEPDSEVRPGDLVLGISVTPKTPLPYEAFYSTDRALESSPLKLYSFSCMANSGCITFDEEGGFGYSGTEEGVTSHAYWAAAAERKAWMQEHRACKSTRY